MCKALGLVPNTAGKYMSDVIQSQVIADSNKVYRYILVGRVFQGLIV